MNIHSIEMEKACAFFKKQLINQEDDIIHTFFGKLNIEKKTIYAISSDYHWLLEYWSSGLYKKIGQRISSGIKTWDHMDAEHRCVLKKNNIKYKTDITKNYGNIVDILSVATARSLKDEDLLSLYSKKPIISSISSSIWCKFNIPTLPLKGIECPTRLKPIDIEVKHECFQFGNIKFTCKEMETIHWLLELNSFKEIAWKHQCSQTAERKRIDTIKAKLNCQGFSSSALFIALKDNGITASCLKDYIMPP
ncbi:hypothetical protein [Shewanella surugensis]|uniref:Uncharacterized protein n=1 Tax=Shewanella surugensis TaxID=212020 RepID=A0ABT0L6C0_9GAMM|nr:hypothetical protein [Shewanella surugensis]MCL1123233.1 hypothetical protein [Shewanella surugensis]